MPPVYKYAIVRRPGKNFSAGLTTSNLGTPSYELMLVQHDTYVRALEAIGLQVTVLPAHPDFPDAHFVEDAAVVTPQVAIITNPGAEARRGEQDSIAPVLARHRKTVHITPPGTLDGGDVLMVQRHFFIGISARTNLEGAQQLGRIVEKYGNTWSPLPVGSGLHLKSGLNLVDENTLLVIEDLATLPALEGYNKIIVDRRESYAANTLWVNDHLLIPRGFSATRKKLASLGQVMIDLDVSEVRKMDGGLTCLSIRF